MSVYAEDDLEKTLFVCEDDACGQYYVLSVAASAKKQECPRSSSHGFMSVVTDRTSWWQSNTCATKGCKYYLATAVNTDDKDRCLGCKKPPVEAGGLPLDKLPGYGVTGESGEIPSTIQTLKSEIDKHKDWKTSHHSDTTSKGVMKKGGSAAREKHSKAGHANSIAKAKKVEFLNQALTAVIKWKLKKGDDMSPGDLKHYKEFVGQAGDLITRFGGKPVTEEDFPDT